MKTFSVKGPNGILGGVETGTGPPLVLVAGLGSTYRLWGELPDLLGRLFTVVAFDNRGIGRSGGGAPFSLITAAEDLLAVIDERCGGRAAVLGASMGGVIALHAAVRSPDHVRRAVVVSSAAHLGHHGRRMLELLAELMDRTAPDRVGHHLMSLAFAPPFHENHAGFVRDAEELYGLGLEDVPGARAQVRHLLAGWDLRPSLAATLTPALVVAGRRDPVVAFEDSELIARLMPNGRFLPVEEAGHSVLAEGGGPVLDAIVAFLSSRDGHPPKPDAV